MSVKRTSIVFACIALSAATPVLAAPAREFTITDTSETTTVTWQAVGSGGLLLQDFMDAAGCTPGVHDCDDTLIHVPTRGTLTVSTSSTDPAAVDSDLQLFVSNAAGEPLREVQESAQANPTPNERVSVAVVEGYYIARIDYALSVNGRVDGVAKFEPPATNPPACLKDYGTTQGLSAPVHEVATESVFLPMADGRAVYLEITRPTAAGLYGVIIEASPYHGTIYERDGVRILPQPRDASGNPIGLTRYFAERGYAVVMMDLRGTGKSQGCLDILGPKDASDLKTVVEWAASQSWSNGRVGMVGHSYPGSTPVVAAAQAPAGLVTIVPSAGLAQVYDHQFQTGVPWNAQWLGPAHAYNELALIRALPPGLVPPEISPLVPVEDNTGENFGNDPEEAACGLTQSAFLTGESMLSGQEVDYHRERDWRAGAIAWDGNVFMVHGVNDDAARIPSIEWFYARSGRAGDKTWIGQWDHGIGCCPNGRGLQWTYALHAWFDRQLLERDVDTGPHVELFLNDEETDLEGLFAQGEVLTATGWPLPSRLVTFNATPDGKLTAEPAADGQRSFVGDANGFVNGREAAGRTEFVSEPLAADLLVAGLPTLELSLSQTLPRVHTISSVVVESPEGARRRIGNCAMNPELRNGIDTITPVTPAARMELRPQCWTMAHHLRAGDRLVLEVATSDPDHIPTFAVDPRVTVFTGPSATALQLPVVDDPALCPDEIDLQLDPFEGSGS